MFDLEVYPFIQIHYLPMIHWDMHNVDEVSTGNEKESECSAYSQCLSPPPVELIARWCEPRTFFPGSHPGAPLQDKLSVVSQVLSRERRVDQSSVTYHSTKLEDWATALNEHHATNLVHGNLTPGSSPLRFRMSGIALTFLQESVGVVHGRGILFRRGSPDRELSWADKLLDDDVYGARWAATELFRLDNGDLCPTTMSDVYSFACLMLQMLTGSVPYCGTKRPEQVVYLKYLGREPIDAETSEIADHHAAFMRWCWSPEPEKRPTMNIVIGFIHEEIQKLRDQHD